MGFTTTVFMMLRPLIVKFTQPWDKLFSERVKAGLLNEYVEHRAPADVDMRVLIM